MNDTPTPPTPAPPQRDATIEDVTRHVYQGLLHHVAFLLGVDTVTIVTTNNGAEGPILGPVLTNIMSYEIEAEVLNVAARRCAEEAAADAARKQNKIIVPNGGDTA